MKKHWPWYVVILLCLLMACSWGLGELRGRDNVVREINAQRNLEAVDNLLVGLPERVPVEGDRSLVDGELKGIKKRALDEIQRAKVRQAGDGYVADSVDPDSAEEDAAFNELAGLERARDVRRRKLREAPAKIVKGVARVIVSAIPWWIWAIVIVLIATTVGPTVWALVLRWRTKLLGLAVREYDDAIERLPPEQRKEIAFGDNLKKVHFPINEQRRKEFEAWVSKKFPGLTPQPNKDSERLKQVGEHIPTSHGEEKPPAG